jgi:hypothetical protein
MEEFWLISDQRGWGGASRIVLWEDRSSVYLAQISRPTVNKT